MKGVDELADAVKVTLGPKGRNVIIGKIGQEPKITKDGVTVAKEIELEDALENMGATVVKRVAEKSNDAAGDGTTTATVLTQAILREGMKLVAAGYDPVQMQKGINFAAGKLVEELNKSAVQVSHDSEMIKSIATISANNDEEIGKIIAEAFASVGEDGAVSVEEGSGFETVVHKVDGLQFDRGLLSTYFSTSPEKAEVSMRNPLILVVQGKLTTTEQAMAIIQPVIKLGRGLVVLADDIIGDALSTLILNKMKGRHCFLTITKI
jgi:chaperonin GroEL